MFMRGIAYMLFCCRSVCLFGDICVLWERYTRAGGRVMGSGCMGGGGMWYSGVVWYRDCLDLREACLFPLGERVLGWFEGVFRIGGYICKVSGWSPCFAFRYVGGGGMVWLAICQVFVCGMLWYLVGVWVWWGV